MPRADEIANRLYTAELPPNITCDGTFEPANGAATCAAAYLEQHQNHPALLPSPYCYFSGNLVLPELPEVEPDRHRGGWMAVNKPRQPAREKPPASWDEFPAGGHNG